MGRIYWILGQLCEFSLRLYLWPWHRYFKVKIWNSLMSGIGRPTDLNERGVSQSLMTLTMTSVTMVGCMDVLDFRCQRAVNTSSFHTYIAGTAITLHHYIQNQNIFLVIKMQQSIRWKQVKGSEQERRNFITYVLGPRLISTNPNP